MRWGRLDNLAARQSHMIRGTLLLMVLLKATSTAAGPTDWLPKNAEVHGFLLGNVSGRTTGQRPGGKEGGDFLLGEERLRLDLFGWLESVEASGRVKMDFIHDAVAKEFDMDLREGYLDYTRGPFDFRLGRQIITWGVGDLLFINDVFPKDYVSFFSGRPLEYLKVGVDGFRGRYSSRPVNVELIVVPFFEPSVLPTPDRFFLFDPFSAVSARDKEEPDTTFENTELAVRIYRRLGGFDVSAYAYKGFWREPSMRPDDPLSPARITAFHPELSVYGLSAQGSAFNGVLSIETGYYHSRDDQDGDDPTVPNSQIRFLAGYQRQVWRDFTLGIQYYWELMEDHSAFRGSLPRGFPVTREYRDTVTLRLEQLLRHQTLRLSLFAFYSPTDNDFLLQPQVSYKFTDHISAAVGANIFGGEKETTFLGQFDKNDNVYLQVRFDF